MSPLSYDLSSRTDVSEIMNWSATDVYELEAAKKVLEQSMSFTVLTS